MSAPEFELPAVEAPFEVPHLDPQKPSGDPVAEDGGVLIPPAAGADAKPTYIPQAVLEADAKLASAIVNLVPGIGTVKGVIEGFTGKDLITGDEKAGWERALNLAAALPVAEEAVEEGALVVKVIEGIHHVHEIVHVAHVGLGVYEVNEASEGAGEGAENDAGESAGAEPGTGGLNPPPTLPH